MNRLRYALSAFVAALLVFSIAPPAASSTSPNLEAKRDALFQSHLDARKSKCGANSLQRGPNLEDAALYHADDMADENYVSHDSQNPYVRWDVRIERYIDPPRYAAGENIGFGHSTASSVMTGWRNSAGHWRNVMDCSFKWVGFGYAYNSSSTYDHYWVADFAY